MDKLHIRANNVHLFQQSNDRPNVHLVVRQMVHPAKSFLNLAFLIPDKLAPGFKPPKFLIFFDNIAESIAAAKVLRNHLPPELRWMIKWFNADMSPQFRDDESANLKQGVTWGLCCTDSFGMVITI
jgi:superfamily II DNA helicase RecQ